MNEHATTTDRTEHETPTVDRRVPGTGNRFAKNGVAFVLERMSLDEWDALMAGDITADDLEAKYRPGADDRDDLSEQADLGEWCA